MEQKLEEMGSFFNARAQTYEEHMFQNVDGATEYYRETAALFPQEGKFWLLDLGCGSGLELDEIFKRNPQVQVTGIDLSEGLLSLLRAKHRERMGQITLIQDSYFTVELGTACYDGVVSVESLHHFTHEEKLGLYQKLYRCLKPGGFFVETDYYAPDQAYEDFYFAENRRLRQEQGITEGFYHYDTPCTVENQLALMKKAGFPSPKLLWQRKGTGIILAEKM